VSQTPTKRCEAAKREPAGDALIPMSEPMFQRLKRREFDTFSLPRAYQIAARLGLKIEIVVE
jgi:hypothetical protein